VSRWLFAALTAASLAIAFGLIAQGAYRGYFQDDEIDTLSWAPELSSAEYARAFITPRYLENNFRPVGHWYFHEFGRMFGLSFSPYIISIQVFHLLNIWLIWLICRRMGVSEAGAFAGTMFFAFHPAIFEVYWKPMYVYDELCTTFCLISFLAWLHDKWLISFLAFWLAYKSKELAVMLPFAIILYEYTLGKRRWKILLPFVLISLSFGLQGILKNGHQSQAYSFAFTPSSLLSTSAFYSAKLFAAPLLAIGFVLLAVFLRDRRAWLGLALVFLFFVPLLFLPGRIYPAYCYLPLTGAALAVAVMAGRYRWRFVLGGALMWSAVSVVLVRRESRATLAADEENRRYVTALAKLAATSPGLRDFVWDGSPSQFEPWGIHGAVRYLWRRDDFHLMKADDANAPDALAHPGAVLLEWKAPERTLLTIGGGGVPAASPFISMASSEGWFQLDSGWYMREDAGRWIKPVATARLRRPDVASTFELKIFVAADRLRKVGPTQVSVKLQGEVSATKTFNTDGFHSIRFAVPTGSPGPVRVELDVMPPYTPDNDSRTLGVIVMSLGFRE
jgi:hypothetical protein